MMTIWPQIIDLPQKQIIVQVSSSLSEHVLCMGTLPYSVPWRCPPIRVRKCLPIGDNIVSCPIFWLSTCGPCLRTIFFSTDHSNLGHQINNAYNQLSYSGCSIPKVMWSQFGYFNDWLEIITLQYPAVIFVTFTTSFWQAKTMEKQAWRCK